MLEDLESDRVERKLSASDQEKIRQAICAFANDMPGHGETGVLFIGAQDDGSCAGLDITDELLTLLAGMRGDGSILPFPNMRVRKRVLKGCELAVVEVEPSRDLPVRVKGRTWIRVGPRRATASPEQERLLAERRRAAVLPYDIRSVPGATLADLDAERFLEEILPAAVSRDVRAENSRSLNQQMASLRLVTAEEEPEPTVLGVLTLGRSPRDWIPGAYIQFLRFDGTALTDPIKDEKNLAEPVGELLARIDEVLQAHISVAVDVTSREMESRRPDYPLVALRQLVRNAVLHRNYEGTAAPVRVNWFNDRIEIQNPGGPFGQVSMENFGQPGLTDYRNPHLAEMLKYLGFVQRFGVGLEIARKAMRDNGNPPPEFKVQQNHVQVILRRAA